MRRFNRGLFHIQLLDREEGGTQPVAVGIDPGSKREGMMVKCKAHTFLNIQATAVEWVKDAVERTRCGPPGNPAVLFRRRTGGGAR